MQDNTNVICKISQEFHRTYDYLHCQCVITLCDRKQGPRSQFLSGWGRGANIIELAQYVQENIKKPIIPG